MTLSTLGTTTQLAISDYQALRLRAAVQPFGPSEDELSRAAAGALAATFGWEPVRACTGGRRHALYRRDLALHESLLLDLPASSLDQLLDGIQVIGLERLAHVPPNRGLLLLSVHYWLSSSWLWMWLVRAAHQGLIPSLDLAIDSRGHGFGLPPEALERWQAAGMYSPETSRLLDVSDIGGAGAAHRMRHDLRSKQAVLLLPDLYDETNGAGPLVTLGGVRCAVPAGLDWLVAQAPCSLAGVHIRPDGDGHAIVFGDPVIDPTPADAVQTLQRLLNQTANAQPCLYAGLTSLAPRGGG